MKTGVHELQSTMRRRQGGETRLAREVGKYFTTKKVVIKADQKTLKGMDSNSMDKNHETQAIISTLREVETVNSAVLESVLTFIAGKGLQSNLSNWSLVSKLVHPKRVASKGDEKNVKELEKVDAALQSLIGHKKSKSDCLTNVEGVQNWLGKLETSIQDVEEGIENHFRCLLKTRVSLLNMINR